MPALQCPHCGAENAEGAAFCEKCGKALPSSAPSGPRVVAGKDIATTEAGQALQMDQLRKQAGRASGILLGLAGLQVVVGAIFYFAFRDSPDVNTDQLRAGVIVVLVLGGVFFGLGFWARVSPLPAAIAGLVIYATFSVIDVILSGQYAPFVIGIKVVIIVLLIGAVTSGAKYRQIKAQAAASAGAPAA
ncbi:MAG: zinc ribbon domain-containing protein [Planctomycetota bacterium]|jgi:peptidoglycan/LPS O-acetylase OafA/YrhL